MKAGKPYLELARDDMNPFLVTPAQKIELGLFELKALFPCAL